MDSSLYGDYKVKVLIIMLIDGGSVSVLEIFVVVVKEFGGIKFVGMKLFGKGMV